MAIVALSVLPATVGLAAAWDITTVAGSGPAGTVNGGFSGDGGPATSALLNNPQGVAVDGAGNLLIADRDSYKVRRVEGVASVSATVTPTGLQAVAGNGQVTLSWNAVSGATYYTLYMATTPWTTWYAYLPEAMRHENISSTSYLHTDLANGTTYYFAIAAVGPGGESAQSSQVSATPSATPATPTPTGLQAVAGNGQVTLSWNAVTGATSYVLYMATTPWTTWSEALPGAMRHTGITQPSFLHDGLPNGTTHYFAIAAVGPGGESGQSSQVSATPSAQAGVPITGTVTLQGRTATSPTGVGHGIARVALNSGGVTVTVNADGSFQISNVAAGTYTLTASAPGYVSRERPNVAVAGSPVTAPSTELRCGLVNSDIFVNINDITATVASFGRTLANRVDALGRFVDQNGDSFVNINDITCVVSGFGVTSPLPWP